jgi:hypothetical protein
LKTAVPYIRPNMTTILFRIEMEFALILAETSRKRTPNSSWKSSQRRLPPRDQPKLSA